MRTRDDRDPLCTDCACERVTDNARSIAAGHGEAWRRRALATIAWADAGGIERADQGALWRARMRKYVTALREQVDTPLYAGERKAN